MMRLRRRYQFEFLLVLEQLFGNAILKRLRMRWKQRLLKKIASDLKDISSPPPLPVERVTDIRPEEFKAKFLHGDRAVIFSGAAKHWACCQKWSLDHFDEVAGQESALIVGAPGLTQAANKTEVDVE